MCTHNIPFSNIKKKIKLKHAPVFFCRTGICQTQDIFLREIGTKTIYTFLTLV